MNIKQFIPQEICLKCDGCCRFNYPDTIWAPSGRKTVSCQDYYICEWFNQQTHKCKGYARRPFDCLIYPFLLLKKEGRIYLSADLKCPYLTAKFDTDGMRHYAQYLYNLLNSEEGIAYLEKNMHLFIEYDEELKVIGELKLRKDGLGRALKIKDKPLFDRYLALEKHELSSFSFANILIWQAHFDICYRIIRNNLCVFFRGQLGTFMYLPPLGKNVDRQTIKECFTIMDAQNKNPQICRIENIEEGQVDFYKKNGLKIYPKDKEYTYERKDLVALAGDKFKSKRASYNYFVKHHAHEFSLLEKAAIDDCLKVLESWKKERLLSSRDDLYRNILEDNFLAQKEALLNYDALSLLGAVVMIDKEVRGYTLGFELNDDTFCVLAEACDLKFKGMPQFLFREFCRRLGKYKYINVMDDSGLANLRVAKLSYRPKRKINSYILERAQ